jgi:hypothetical protein
MCVVGQYRLSPSQDLKKRPIKYETVVLHTTAAVDKMYAARGRSFEIRVFQSLGRRINNTRKVKQSHYRLGVALRVAGG